MAGAKKFADTCKGKTIEGKYDIQKVCKNLLIRFHAIKRESVVALFLDEKNHCIDVKVRFGSKSSLKFHTKEICSKAPIIKARNIIVAYNHNEEKTSPTRIDLMHAATLYTNLPDGVKLCGYVVWCKNQAISLLDSYEFKQIISGYSGV
ncbi:MAG: JAB domain-containing protein [Candidatus Omnitrophota bacterium]